MSNLLPSGLALIRWRHLDAPRRWIGALIGLLVAFELANDLYFLPVVKNNLFLFHAYTVAEFAVLSMAYYHHFVSRWLRRLILWLIGVFTVLCIVNAIWWQPLLTHFNSLPRSIEALILLSYALLYMRQLLDELVVEDLSRHPMFWVSVAVLVYFSGTFFLFAAERWLTGNLPFDMRKQLWVINILANVVFNLFLTVALWLPSDSRPTPVPS